MTDNGTLIIQNNLGEEAEDVTCPMHLKRAIAQRMRERASNETGLTAHGRHRTAILLELAAEFEAGELK